MPIGVLVSFLRLLLHSAAPFWSWRLQVAPTSGASAEDSRMQSTPFVPSASQRAMSRLSSVLTIAVHLVCLLGFVVPLTRAAAVLAVAGYIVRMWAVTTGYHRYFSHRSFKTGRVFQFILAWLGASAMENGPLWWASWHRRHHRHSDTPQDAHSPVQYGFWQSHMGWFIWGQADYPDLSNVQDLAKFPELRWIDKYKWVPLVAHAAMCTAIAGVPGLIWGFFVSSIAVLQVTALINSLAHVVGSRRFQTSDDSRNNWLLALLTFGEGWHNNHHQEMSSAKQGYAWWELDMGYAILWLLEKAGVVWDVRTHASIAAKRARAPQPVKPDIALALLPALGPALVPVLVPLILSAAPAAPVEARTAAALEVSGIQ
jgi:stearoyl-CoA desaturase (Delta-9 desaturase)